MAQETVESAQAANQEANGKRGIPFNVALVLPAQLTVLAVVLCPTLIVLWLAITDWQPTSGVPWYQAEPVWFWNFYDLYYDFLIGGAMVPRNHRALAECFRR